MNRWTPCSGAYPAQARWDGEPLTLQAPPPLSRIDRRGQPKLFLSATLGDAQIRDVYSELMSLDV